MKTTRTADDCPIAKDRRPFATIGTLLSVTIAACTGFCYFATVQSRNEQVAPEARVEGNLVVDGKVTQLRYVYAFRREASPPYTGAIVDLIITNQSLPEASLGEILDERYRGSETTKGLWLTFAPSGELADSSFLLESGAVSESAAGTAITMGQGGQTIENGRISGQLGYRRQEVSRTIAYTVSFDAPLKDVVRDWSAGKGPQPANPVRAGQTRPPLRRYRFDTVTVNARGVIVGRGRRSATYYVERIGGIGIDMVRIPGGSFTMGSSGVYEAHPAHQVTMPGFFMGKYEVTQAQWRAVAKLPRVLVHLDADPSHFKGDDLPVESVTWQEAIEFCARLSRATGRVYRLPAEAEWEYACRAGTETPFTFGETLTSRLANYHETAEDRSSSRPRYRERTATVGSLRAANRFGLYDMHGNVSEWCMDAWHQFYVRAPVDGSVWEEGGDRGNRVIRGGSWHNLASLCRADYRFREHESRKTYITGLRVVGPTARQHTEQATSETAPGVRGRETAFARPRATAGPGGLPLNEYEFETVRVDLLGVIESRERRRARSYVEVLDGTRLEMVEVPAGVFKMGWTEDDRERPVHQVRVPAFFMGKFEVTQAQWRAVAKLPRVNRYLNPDPSHFKGDTLPVDSVSWNEAIEFCSRLSRATRRTYCLPTEAEWEYAGRGGTTSEFALGDNITPDLVNYDGRFSMGSAPKGEFRKQTIPVGSLGVANRFGLYDMDGNLREWCMDAWHENYKGAPGNGSAWLTGGEPDSRVTRGGSWDLAAHMCRVADRNWCPPDSCRLEYFGFRVVMDGRRCVQATKPTVRSSRLSADAKPRQDRRR
jgi:formylglycine-generating enzyme required for sulfatase activity